MTATTSTSILKLIDTLEVKLKKGDASLNYVEGLQQQLNDGSVLSSDDRYHQYAFELQALIYKAEDKEDAFSKCMGAAVEQAGSIQKLHSKLLKTYAREDATITSAETSSRVMRPNLGDASLLTKREQAFLRNHGLETMPNIDFFTRSTPLFILLFLASGGIYGTYWLYKNWQAVRNAADVKFSPLWRTLLSIVYLWPLFKIMTVLAKSHGFKPRYSGGVLAAGYILTAFVGAAYELSIKNSRTEAISIQIVTSCFYALFLVMAQQTAALALSKRSNATPKARPISYAEILFVVIGLAFLVVSFTDYKPVTLKSNGSTLGQTQLHSTKR